jgi:hypothetical protein
MQIYLKMFDHGQLVEAARVWLYGNQRCSVVITELMTSAMEIPDAIGWQSGGSILVECKTSRSDFKADAKKFFRKNADYGIGNERYFLTPPGLVQVEELPENWGLIEWNGKRVRRLKKSGQHCAAAKFEVLLLLSALRRVGQINPKGVSIKCHTIPSRNTATLSMPDFSPAGFRGGMEVAA